MKILFNVHLLLRTRTGIGLYKQHLIQALVATKELDSIIGFVGGHIYRDEALLSLVNNDQNPLSSSTPTARGSLAALKKVIQDVPGAYTARQALREWQNGRRIGALAQEGFIYHEPNYIPVRYAGPLVISAYDLSQVRHPEFHPPERAAFLNKHLGPALQNADQIITISEFSAQEIMDVYQTPRDKITVTHLGADDIFHPRDSLTVAKTLQDIGLRHRGFVLFVATLEPRKNIVRLIDAYSSLPEFLRQDFPLVLTGAAGWQDADILRRIRAAEQKGEVIRTGYLPRTQLADLFSSAAVFAYPSLYEGFGLPVLEGFASGTPVLTSNISSMPEVSAGAAVEVDPYSLEAIADGLQRLLEDRVLAEKHIQAGLIRSKDFSWKSCAEKTLEVYRKVS